MYSVSFLETLGDWHLMVYRVLVCHCAALLGQLWPPSGQQLINTLQSEYY